MRSMAKEERKNVSFYLCVNSSPSTFKNEGALRARLLFNDGGTFQSDRIGCTRKYVKNSQKMEKTNNAHKYIKSEKFSKKKVFILQLHSSHLQIWSRQK